MEPASASPSILADPELKLIEHIFGPTQDDSSEQLRSIRIAADANEGCDGLSAVWLSHLGHGPRASVLHHERHRLKPVTVLGMVAEMERRFIRERQQAGIEEAKRAGAYNGRKPSVPVAQVRAMHGEGHGPSAIAKALKISRMSVHRALSQASI